MKVEQFVRDITRAIRERRLLKSIWKVLASPRSLFFFLIISYPKYVHSLIASKNRVRLSDFRNARALVYQEAVLSNEELGRLCNSYSLMIQESPSDPESPYFVGGLWEEWKIQHQSKLVRALLDNDYSSLRRIFSNLGREDASLGISLSGDFASGTFARALQANRLNTLLATYREIRPGSEVQLYPKKWGAFPGPNMLSKEGLPGVMLPSGPRLSHNARTLSSLSSVAGALTRGKDKWGSIIEIGGGFGGIAYHLKKETDFSGTYINLDILKS